MIARVVQVERDAWRVEGDLDCWATITGRLRYEAAIARLPAVGDWVELTPSAVIERVLQRRSTITRKAAGRAARSQVIAANVDTVFVVTSANADLSERRLERYLAMVWDGGAMPVVVVNKIDLVDAALAIESSLRARLPFVDVVMVSALDRGVADGSQPSARGAASQVGVQLAQWVQAGRTVALVGSSGVGKSTIVNRLVGTDLQRVSAIRRHDGTGRHTTTSRQLIVLPDGGLLIDTPGMRELQPWGDSAVDGAFDDIAALAADCRFGDCSHSVEPGCAVRTAVEAGTIQADRLDHYHRLQREAAHEERRHDKGAAAAQKKRLRTMMRAQRARYRNRGS